MSVEVAARILDRICLLLNNFGRAGRRADGRAERRAEGRAGEWVGGRAGGRAEGREGRQYA